MRRAFSMLMAIFFLILVGTLSMLGLRLTATTTRQSAELYISEQAELLAQGATEYAMVKIFKELPKGCSRFKDPIVGYYPNTSTPLLRYTINLKFFGEIDIVNTTDDCNLANLSQDHFQTSSDKGLVAIDVVVDTKNSSGDQIVGVPTPISFHKRTIQKL